MFGGRFGLLHRQDQAQLRARELRAELGQLWTARACPQPNCDGTPALSFLPGEADPPPVGAYRGRPLLAA